jgi:5-methylcytosine-specific restriction endonuclease McrA
MPKKPNYHKTTGPEDCIDREADNRFYNSTLWRKVRRAFIQSNPPEAPGLCQDCLARGIQTQATEVHHRLDRRQFPDLALSMENLQACCHSCHLSKRKFL